VTNIFRDYGQAGLDAQYDNRMKVPDSLEMLRAGTERSAMARTEISGQLNVSFGPAVEESLDIFPAAPAAISGPAPIQVFIHGGYWRKMHKDDFSYVARAFTPRGCATVVINYGLIPTIDMDELVRQCRAALAWTHRNAAGFGGDPERIFISGHSAGGHLVAMMMATDWPRFDAQSPALPVDLVKGGCGISGLYDLEPIRLCFLNEELKLDPETAARNSPLALAPGGPGSLLLAVGSEEGPEYQRQSEDLAAAWRRHGIAVEVVVLAGQNHFTIVEQLGDPDAALSRLILDQMGQGAVP
jgi:arylformamidase